VQKRVPSQEIKNTPQISISEIKQQQGEYRLVGGISMLTRGGIKQEDSLISRPAGQNYIIANHTRQTGNRILNEKDYQGTDNIPRVGTNRYSSPSQHHTTAGMAVSRILNTRQFSPVPPHLDGSPRVTNKKTYDQSEGLMIEVGGS
jgi:hypothetical protein